MAKSIDELYQEVRDYDLVMCNDAPLALALNNRLDKPRLGAFALTPRQLAGDLSMDILGKPIYSDTEAVKKVSRLVGEKLRYVHGEIENFRKIRRYTNDVKRYIRSRKAKTVFDEYMRIPTLERAMELFDGENAEFFKGKRIAVIGPELYDSLDKMMNPKFGTFEEINPFRRGRFEIPEFRSLSNDRQMAENAVDLITKENASDIAIVLDVNGQIADAVRSALYRKRIPFINNLNMRDLSVIRDFLEFLTRSLNFKTVKVGQIRELISTFGGWIDSRFDEYLAESFMLMVQKEETLRILSTMDRITELTYGEVCNIIAPNNGAQIKILLSQMELTDEKVSFEETDNLLYAVNNFNDLKHSEQIPAYEKEGVLLVDCKNSVYIDRPVVFYLGMGTEWDADLSDLDLVDYKLKEDVLERDTAKFQILLQQGMKRVYFCNSIKDGKEPKPCSLFETAEGSGTVYYRFGDIAECVSGPWYRPPEPKKRSASTAEIVHEGEMPPFSKTTFDAFVNCPKLYMYNTLLGNPDKGNTLMGTILHEYAEFRICHPEIVREKGAEYYVGKIAEDCLGLFTPDVRGLMVSKIRTSVKNIDRFVDYNRLPEKVRLDSDIKQKNNRFFKDAGMPYQDSHMTELEFSSKADHIHGVVDIIDGSTVFDFKTGKVKNSKELLNALNENKEDEQKEFQCLFYLSLIEELGLGNEKFTLFFTSANEEKSVLNIDYDIRDNMVDVKLVDDPGTMVHDYVYNELFEIKSYAPLSKYAELLCSIAEDAGYDPEKVRSADSADIVITAAGNSTKTFRDKAIGALKNISNVCSDLCNCNGTLYVTKKALSDFREKVAAAYEEIGKMYYGRFPADPLFKCEKCYYKDVCTIETDGGE